MANVFYGCLIAIGIIFVVCLVLFCVRQKKRYYLCPHCGYKYKPGGLAAFFSRREDYTKRLLVCPMCGYRDYMENYDDADGPKRYSDMQNDDSGSEEE